LQSSTTNQSGWQHVSHQLSHRDLARSVKPQKNRLRFFFLKWQCIKRCQQGLTSIRDGCVVFMLYHLAKDSLYML